ncbi:two-component system nitrate/nitrite sensor histidine kinase NarQ [Paenibacillus anaericanus]|uniref:sensor histidine kinase n=1 Tax=Paenibacillus anaericanus TaxID=170367 RepID=UPI0027865E48|nr:histidine kinase [Paenibacillus anaericanus]MDQ0087069.1 two-component system nitrate/nitrite sensor histidine kinase NarQ [Paenibacillus anaericanus]
MTYKQIKWMILFIPTLTVGIWEYVRHQFLLSYISMDIGNWITPLLVYIVSVTLLSRLFSMLEKIQRELESERANKGALEAREQLAKELHDGVAQSLFLLSVKIDRLEFTTDQAKLDHEIYKIRKTVHEVNRYVRQAISHLSYSTTLAEDAPQRESLDEKVKQIAEEVLISMDVDWNISDESLNSKEKVELLACIREAVINIQKHAHATKGWIEGKGNKEEWKVTIKDNGIGLQGDPFNYNDSYGLNIMDERAKEMNWDLRVVSENNYTKVELHKAGEMR